MHPEEMITDDMEVAEKLLEDFSVLSLNGGPADHTLPVFADFPGPYNPKEDWLDGSSPKHPFFDKANRIHQVVFDIKFNLEIFLITGCYRAVNGLLPSSSARAY